MSRFTPSSGRDDGAAARGLGKCLQCGEDNDYPLAAICTSCQKGDLLTYKQWKEKHGE